MFKKMFIESTISANTITESRKAPKKALAELAKRLKVSPEDIELVQEPNLYGV